MSKRMIYFAAILLVVLLLAVSNCFYIVSERERGLLLRFGQIVSTNINPGLHIKIPVIDKLIIFDGRLQTSELPSSRFLTQEKKAVIVDAYVKWRIDNVQEFYRATSGDMFRANTLLSQRVESRLRNKFGSLKLTDVVSGQRDELMKDITVSVDSVARKTLGLHVVDVRVRKIDLPSSVSESVFNRMQSEREKEAREYRAQGQEAAFIIQADADKQKQIIIANAKKEADILRGEGDAQATIIYAKAYNKDKQFYSFYKSLTAYKKSFNSASNLLILNSDSAFFKYFNKNTLPSLEEHQQQASKKQP